MLSYFLNARQMDPDTVLSVRVDRDQELDACLRYLAHRGENVFLWGVRGIGKTFLVRLVQNQLQKVPSILPVNVDVLGLPGFGRVNTATAFPEAVLLGICYTIWKEILGKPYSELRARLDLREGDIRFPSKLARAVETIYMHVMASQRKSHYEYSNLVGFSAGAKGEKKETGWVEQVQPPILPFEFLEFCEELIDALRETGKTHVVALCDEANILPFHQQREILSRYVDLFTSRRVQFLFVAGVLDWDCVPPPVPDGFDLVTEVGELASEYVIQLLQKAAHSANRELDVYACEVAHKHAGGNPRLLLQALDHAVHATEETSKAISAHTMLSACETVLAQWEEHRRLAYPQRKAQDVNKNHD